MKKYKVGYTQGVFDMFHIGHLNLLLNARKMCETLIVGVNSERLVQEYKQKTPIIDEESRLAIVSNIKGVDRAFITNTLDKLEIWHDVHFDAIFIGSDWKGNERWMKTAEQLKAVGADVVFLPHTPGISSTMLRTKKEISDNI